MRVLFIGGTGIISSACTRRAIDTGIEIYCLNRGRSFRPLPDGARLLVGDIREPSSVVKAMGDLTFDVVVDWVAFEPGHVETDINLFSGRAGQYIFISSASAYQTPPARLPVTESTPLHNPFWAYSRAKIACEEMLLDAYRNDGFPATIVRPSHTYDKTLLPLHGGYTVVDRMRRGASVIVHGDGSSLWVLTHHSDFAVGLLGLFGKAEAIGEAYHITSDELLTWNQITEIIADAAGASANIVHVPSEVIAAHDPEWGAGLLGDKTHSMIFDNAKIKRLVPEFSPATPFSEGAREIMNWYDGDANRHLVDRGLDATMDAIIAAQRRARP